MNWDNLRFFLAVVEKGSIAEAAGLLSVNHSTVVRRIAQLEKDLSLKLFHRLATGYQLTAEGEMVANQAQALERNMLELQQKSLEQELGVSGALRIAALDNQLVDIASPCADFAKQYPAVQLDIQLSSDTVNLNQLEADVAIRLSNSPDELLVGREVGKVKFRPYIARQLLSSLGEGPFEHYPWISWSESNGGMQFDRWLRSKSTDARVVASTNSESAALALVHTGVGVAYLPALIADAEEALCVLPIEPAELTCGLWVLTHRELRHSEKIKVFIEHIATALRGQLDKQLND